MLFLAKTFEVFVFFADEMIQMCTEKISLRNADRKLMRKESEAKVLGEIDDQEDLIILWLEGKYSLFFQAFESFES